MSPSEAVELVRTELASQATLADYTARRMSDTMARFATYLERGHDVTSSKAIKFTYADGFIRAPLAVSGGHREPSVATMHLRRSALRLFFRIARELGVLDGDPTLDVVLPFRSTFPVRPLIDDEVILCRSFSVHTLRSTRRPAAWALAEATARTAEIPHVLISDVDLERASVWIHGSPKTLPRWGHLSAWGVHQIERRVEILRERASANASLIYEGDGSPESRQASSCVAISQTLQDAGLSSERGIRPASVAAWAGARAFSESGCIDEVARRLGIRSLDRTARLIGWDWRSAEAEESED